MLIIRLQRVGRTNDPSFRVIVTDSKNAAKTGKFLEIVGNYDARQGKPEFKAERIQHWIKNGAQVSDTVHNLLVKNKIISGEIINQIPAKKVVPEAPAPATASKAETPVAESVTEETPVTAEETPVVEAEEVAEVEAVAEEKPVE